jgi:hypothetical protein
MIHSRKRFEEWLPAAFDGEFDWDILAQSFVGTKIMPMDFDAVIERNGHFLVLETKQAGKQIDKGQSITLSRAWKEKDFTIIHIVGKSAPSISGFAIYSEWDIEKQGNVGDREIKSKNAVDLVFAVRCWFCKASNLEIPSREDWDRQIWKADYEAHEIS